ncbi:hypothetical protein [Roseobacter sp. CCS2]|uniref:hypothetical protein n=1 Tax=Roseobacter sp. CCS2 TaxID=391593 RepID=UPI0012E99C55|nr:hypothetical protein [Roseobacter sp. CCS2]
MVSLENDGWHQVSVLSGAQARNMSWALLDKSKSAWSASQLNPQWFANQASSVSSRLTQLDSAHNEAVRTFERGRDTLMLRKSVPGNDDGYIFYCAAALSEQSVETASPEIISDTQRTELSDGWYDKNNLDSAKLSELVDSIVDVSVVYSSTRFISSTSSAQEASK